MIQLIEKWENIDTLPIPASTVFKNGDALSFNGSGSLIPSVPGAPIVGFSGQKIDTTDPDYASAIKMIYYQKAGSIGDNLFLCPVGVGTLLASMVGKVFNVSAADAGALDVSAYNTIIYNTLAVGVFVAGHTITGGTSGATGVIASVNTLADGSQQVSYTVTAGVFIPGETITDGTTSATAKILTLIAGGTQLKVEKFLSATLAKVSVALTA